MVAALETAIMYSNNRIQANSSSSSSSFQTTTTRTTTTTSSNLVRPSFNQQPVEPQETNYYTQPARKELSSNKQHLQTSLSQTQPQTRPAAVAAVENDPNMPDLSHLSEDERKIIEAVLARQKAEEEMDSKLSQLNPAPYR